MNLLPLAPVSLELLATTFDFTTFFTWSYFKGAVPLTALMIWYTVNIASFCNNITAS